MKTRFAALRAVLFLAIIGQSASPTYAQAPPPTSDPTASGSTTIPVVTSTGSIDSNAVNPAMPGSAEPLPGISPPPSEPVNGSTVEVIRWRMYTAWYIAAISQYMNGDGPDGIRFGILDVYEPWTLSHLYYPRQIIGQIYFDPNQPEDRIIADQMASNMQTAASLQDIQEGIEASAESAEFAIRLFNPAIDTSASIIEFKDKPSFYTAIGLIPILPSIGRAGGEVLDATLDATKRLPIPTGAAGSIDTALSSLSMRRMMIPNRFVEETVLDYIARNREAFEAASGKIILQSGPGPIITAGDVTYRTVGNMNFRTKTITLYEGHEIQDLVEELVHYRQAVDNGYWGTSRILEKEMRKAWEDGVDNVFHSLGFVPR